MARDKDKDGKGKGGGKGKNRPAKTPEEIREAANNKALTSLYGKEGVEGGNALINKFLQPGSLGRVGTDIPQGSVGNYQNLLTKASERDPMQSEVLNNMQAGLGGYTAPQYQAQREQMQRGLNSGLATSTAQLAKAQARAKMYGPAAAAQFANLNRSTQASRDQLEQDLYVKNIDEMDRRNLQYGQYGRQLNNEEFDRQAQATKGLGDEQAALRAEELERQKINIGQANAEQAAQIGAFTGAGATSLGKQAQAETNKIQKQGIQAVNGGGTIKERAKKRVAGRRM